ncbi:MAG: hypothetical protein JWQ49_2145 [Edaphobacter sp.]|nr:hypothetical protein [Edaphobacter sp.]
MRARGSERRRRESRCLLRRNRVSALGDQAGGEDGGGEDGLYAHDLSLGSVWARCDSVEWIWYWRAGSVSSIGWSSCWCRLRRWTHILTAMYVGTLGRSIWIEILRRRGAEA